MEYRQLGGSGFKVPVLSLGTGTFGGGDEFFKAWGASDVAEATRLVDICLDAGLTMFDSADVYSSGMAEEILGQAIKGRRDQVLISTKGTFRIGTGPQRRRLLALPPDPARSRRACGGWAPTTSTSTSCTASTRMTPVEEVLGTLDDLVRAGKIRYIGCSNFSGWHLMKSLAVSEKYGLARYVAHQAYYSLVGRDYEWELMPLALDQKVGAVVWSPLGWGRLTGKIRRGQPLPRDQPAAEQARHRHRPAGRRRVPLPGRRRPRRGRAGDRQDRAAGRAQLAAPAADGGERHHRRPQRGAAAAEPRRRRLEPDRRSRSPGSTPPAPRRPPIPTGTSAASTAQPAAGLNAHLTTIPEPPRRVVAGA